MKISSRLDYALSCAIVLASMYKEKQPIPVAFIARREKLAYDYVEQLLRALKKNGIVKSVRGARGGYVLSSPPEKIMARDIVIAIEKRVLKLVCDRKKARRKDCIHFNDCKVRDFWIGLRDNMDKYFSGYTLKDLLKMREKEKGFKDGR